MCEFRSSMVFLMLGVSRAGSLAGRGVRTIMAGYHLATKNLESYPLIPSAELVLALPQRWPPLTAPGDFASTYSIQTGEVGMWDSPLQKKSFNQSWTQLSKTPRNLKGKLRSLRPHHLPTPSPPLPKKHMNLANTQHFQSYAWNYSNEQRIPPRNSALFMVKPFCW